MNSEIERLWKEMDMAHLLGGKIRKPSGSIVVYVGIRTKHLPNISIKSFGVHTDSGAPDMISIWYRGNYPWNVNHPELEAEHSTPSSVKLEIRGAILALHYMSF